MTHRIAPAVGWLWILPALLVASPGPAWGQGRNEAPLFLAIPEVFPDLDARAVLLRERGREIIVLRATDATEETLGMALSLMTRVRERPVAPGRGVMVPVTGFAVTRPLDADVRARLARALESLKSQPIAHIGNLGQGRAMRFRESGR